mmetsp:Transcript_17608/g.52900  ORF Transcript_17608/g.52900 Transcript_17608/m.52900 type:complete len:233 (+) Transcript_17608:1270-1968(+)
MERWSASVATTRRVRSTFCPPSASMRGSTEASCRTRRCCVRCAPASTKTMSPPPATGSEMPTAVLAPLVTSTAAAGRTAKRCVRTPSPVTPALAALALSPTRTPSPTKRCAWTLTSACPQTWDHWSLTAPATAAPAKTCMVAMSAFQGWRTSVRTTTGDAGRAIMLWTVAGRKPTSPRARTRSASSRIWRHTGRTSRGSRCPSACARPASRPKRTAGGASPASPPVICPRAT